MNVAAAVEIKIGQGAKPGIGGHLLGEKVDAAISATRHPSWLAVPDEEEYEILSALDEGAPSYKKIVLKGDRIVGAIFIGQIDRAGIITGLIKERISVSSFKELLLTEDFGLLSLPAEYRKHVVSGLGIEV